MEAQDYKKLVNALRCEGVTIRCDSCDYGYHLSPLSERNDVCHVERILTDAADAIEFLIKDRNFWKDAAIKAKDES